MKNVHVIPTDKPSRLYKSEFTCELEITSKPLITISEDSPNQNIYITNDEEIKEGDWFMSDFNSFPIHNIKELSERAGHLGWTQKDLKNNLKIILTTDQDLIKDGVQAIDDEFLEWFVAHPSCEEVEVIELKYKSVKTNYTHSLRWGIIIPQEKPKLINGAIGIDGISDPGLRGITPKQEILEEDKNKYSEEEVVNLIQFLSANEEFNDYGSVTKETAKHFLKQFKNK